MTAGYNEHFDKTSVELIKCTLMVLLYCVQMNPDVVNTLALQRNFSVVQRWFVIEKVDCANHNNCNNKSNSEFNTVMSHT